MSCAGRGTEMPARAGGHADAAAQGLEHGGAEGGRERARAGHGAGKHAQGAGAHRRHRRPQDVRRASHRCHAGRARACGREEIPSMRGGRRSRRFSARCGLSTQAEDWEKAADVMQRHLKVVPEQDGGSSEEAAMQALRRSLAEMQTIILDKCQAATDAADYKVSVPWHCALRTDAEPGCSTPALLLPASPLRSL